MSYERLKRYNGAHGTGVWLKYNTKDPKAVYLEVKGDTYGCAVPNHMPEGEWLWLDGSSYIRECPCPGVPPDRVAVPAYPKGERRLVSVLFPIPEAKEVVYLASYCRHNGMDLKETFLSTLAPKRTEAYDLYADQYGHWYRYDAERDMPFVALGELRFDCEQPTLVYTKVGRVMP